MPLCAVLGRPRHIIASIFTRFREAPPRTRMVVLNSLGGLLIKGGSFFFSLLTVPLLLSLLGPTQFGVWATLSSFVTFLTLFDLGLGNGLRNRLTEALVHKDITLARNYISTAYAFFGVFIVLLIALFYLANLSISWSGVLKTPLPNQLLRQAILILFIGGTLKLVLDLLTYVLLAYQQAALAGLMTLLTNALALLGVSYLAHNAKGSLPLLAVVTAVAPIVTLTIASIWAYQRRLSQVRPGLRHIKPEYVPALAGLSTRFFVIQLAVMLLFYSDNLIITQLFGPEQVTPYSVCFRYFNLLTAFFSILLAPYWSAFSEAYTTADYGWMQTTYRRLWWFWGGFFVLTVGWLAMAPVAFSAWVGNQVRIPFALSAGMALSVLVISFNSVTVVVVNGLGKIRLQLVSSLFSAVINVPLSIFLGKGLGLGSAGVILATSLSLLSGSILCYIQARRLLNQTATSIWNR